MFRSFFSRCVDNAPQNVGVGAEQRKQLDALFRNIQEANDTIKAGRGSQRFDGGGGAGKEEEGEGGVADDDISDDEDGGGASVATGAERFDYGPRPSEALKMQVRAGEQLFRDREVSGGTYEVSSFMSGFAREAAAELWDVYERGVLCCTVPGCREQFSSAEGAWHVGGDLSRLCSYYYEQVSLSIATRGIRP